MSGEVFRVVHEAGGPAAVQSQDVSEIEMFSCSLLFKTVNNSAFKKRLLTRSIETLAREKKIVYLASFLQDLDQLFRGLQLNNT